MRERVLAAQCRPMLHFDSRSHSLQFGVPTDTGPLDRDDVVRLLYSDTK